MLIQAQINYSGLCNKTKYLELIIRREDSEISVWKERAVVCSKVPVMASNWKDLGKQRRSSLRIVSVPKFKFKCTNNFPLSFHFYKLRLAPYYKDVWGIEV
jgi:hypothetical protein